MCASVSERGDPQGLWAHHSSKAIWHSEVRACSDTSSAGKISHDIPSSQLPSSTWFCSGLEGRACALGIVLRYTPRHGERPAGGHVAQGTLRCQPFTGGRRCCMEFMDNHPSRRPAPSALENCTWLLVAAWLLEMAPSAMVRRPQPCSGTLRLS